jgi:hypothetical protein
MKALAITVLATACVLSGCARTTDGVVAPTTEPVSADGMTCAEFVILGERDQADVIEEILGDEPQSYRRTIAGGLARVLCQTAPEAELEPLLMAIARR